MLTISGSKDISQTSYLATPKAYVHKYKSLFISPILFSIYYFKSLIPKNQSLIDVFKNIRECFKNLELRLSEAVLTIKTTLSVELITEGGKPKSPKSR